MYYMYRYISFWRVQIESGCPNVGSKLLQGQRSPTLVDCVPMEGVRHSKHHQRIRRQESKMKNGHCNGDLGGTRVSNMSKTSSSSSTSSAATAEFVVQSSADSGRAPAPWFGFHSLESATSSTTSLPAATSLMNPWVAAGNEQSKIGGLVRRKSDLGPIAESEKVSKENADRVGSPDQDSGSLRRGRIHASAVVRCATSNLSTVSEPELKVDDEHNLQNSSLKAVASGPQVTSQTNSSAKAARPRVLAMSDHISCLRQKNMRRRDDVITSGVHVTSNGASESATDNKFGVNGDW